MSNALIEFMRIFRPSTENINLETLIYRELINNEIKPPMANRLSRAICYDLDAPGRETALCNLKILVKSLNSVINEPRY